MCECGTVSAEMLQARPDVRPGAARSCAEVDAAASLVVVHAQVVGDPGAQAAPLEVGRQFGGGESNDDGGGVFWGLSPLSESAVATVGVRSAMSPRVPDGDHAAICLGRLRVSFG